MSVQITPELEAIVSEIFSEGEFRDEEEVLREALNLLRKRQQLIRDVNAGVAQLDGDECREYDENSHDRFLDEIRSEGSQSS